ncbi:hypothetical protein NHX12_005115 [Muraenolepis orangiensis]|uniref:Uncharacterized protein n=1 Tax=Muraenolepis orangiensis TaxID=630683 RepID=A0A9Q0DQU0_9TELE|nr:hypothetical protein NHX12_005115 [Muraenolepis orangiensis]
MCVCPMANPDLVPMSLGVDYWRAEHLEVNGIDFRDDIPPMTENELLQMLSMQEEELQMLREELAIKDARILQLELELHNLDNVGPNNV